MSQEYRDFKTEIQKKLKQKTDAQKKAFRSHIGNAVVQLFGFDHKGKTQINRFVKHARKETGEIGGKRNVSEDYGVELIKNFIGSGSKRAGSLNMAIAIYYVFHKTPDSENLDFQHVAQSMDTVLLDNGKSLEDTIGFSFDHTELEQQDDDKLDKEPAIEDPDQKQPRTLKINWNDSEQFFRAVETNVDENSLSLKRPNLRNAKNIQNLDSLINWEYRLVDTIFEREPVMERLIKWSALSTGTSIQVLHGVLGVGKTRLAFEFAERLVETGWEAGECIGGFGANWLSGVEGILFVVDDSDQNTQTIIRFLESLEHIVDQSKQVRALVLCRKERTANLLFDRLQSLMHEPPITLDTLQKEENRWQLLNDVWTALTHMDDAKVRGISNHGEHPEFPFDKKVALRHFNYEPLYSTPLLISLAALMMYKIELDLNSDWSSLGQHTLFRYISKRECERIKAEVMQYNRSEHNLQKLEYQGVALAKALSIISSGIDGNDLRALAKQSQNLELDYPIPDYKYLSRLSVFDGERIEPFNPIIIATDFFSHVIKQYAPHDFGQLVFSVIGLDQIEDWQQDYGNVIKNLDNFLFLLEQNTFLHSDFDFTSIEPLFRKNEKVCLWMTNNTAKLNISNSAHRLYKAACETAILAHKQHLKKEGKRLMSEVHEAIVLVNLSILQSTTDKSNQHSKVESIRRAYMLARQAFEKNELPIESSFVTVHGSYAWELRLQSEQEYTHKSSDLSRLESVFSIISSEKIITREELTNMLHSVDSPSSLNLMLDGILVSHVICQSSNDFHDHNRYAELLDHIVEMFTHYYQYEDEDTRNQLLMFVYHLLEFSTTKLGDLSIRDKKTHLAPLYMFLLAVQYDFELRTAANPAPNLANYHNHLDKMVAAYSTIISNHQHRHTLRQNFLTILSVRFEYAYAMKDGEEATYAFYRLMSNLEMLAKLDFLGFCCELVGRYLWVLGKVEFDLGYFKKAHAVYRKAKLWQVEQSWVLTFEDEIRQIVESERANMTAEEEKEVDELLQEEHDPFASSLLLFE